MTSIIGLDTNLIFWMQEHLVTEVLSPWMVGVSAAGNLGLVWILASVALLCTKKYRRTGAAVLIGLLFSLLVGNMLLKPLVMRLRPCIEYSWMPLLIDAPKVNDFSFPSGHTFSSFAAAAALWCGGKRQWGIMAMLLAAAIGFSRLYLFMHYPSDVLAGAVLGLAFGRLAWYVSGKM